MESYVNGKPPPPPEIPIPENCCQMAGFAGAAAWSSVGVGLAPWTKI